MDPLLFPFAPNLPRLHPPNPQRNVPHPSFRIQPYLPNRPHRRRDTRSLPPTPCALSLLFNAPSGLLPLSGYVKIGKEGSLVDAQPRMESAEDDQEGERGERNGVDRPGDVYGQCARVSGGQVRGSMADVEGVDGAVEDRGGVDLTDNWCVVFCCSYYPFVEPGTSVYCVRFGFVLNFLADRWPLFFRLADRLLADRRERFSCYGDGRRTSLCCPSLSRQLEKVRRAFAIVLCPAVGRC
jgi:hypothetical protein